MQRRCVRDDGAMVTRIDPSLMQQESFADAVIHDRPALARKAGEGAVAD